MKKPLFLTTSVIFYYAAVSAQSAFAVHNQILSCSFGFMGAPIFLTETELNNSDESIGAYTRAAFQGAPSKTVPNIVFSANAPLIYFFQLDEGYDGNNISITVSSKRNDKGEFLAVAENPQSPQFRKMNGTCRK